VATKIVLVLMVGQKEHHFIDDFFNYGADTFTVSTPIVIIAIDKI